MASEYGWTFDEIAQLSLREVDIALRKIHRRRHNAYVQEAALSGVQLDFMQDDDGEAEAPGGLSAEEDAAIDRAIRESLERKKGGRIHG